MENKDMQAPQASAPAPADSALEARIRQLEARRKENGALSDAALRDIVERVANRVRTQTLRAVQKNAARPLENGATGRAPATIRETPPSAWSREERERIGRAALRGKKHTID